MKLELVRDWMSTPVTTILPETLLLEAHQIMIQQKIRRLPVVTSANDIVPQMLVGMVTLGDIRAAEPSIVASLGTQEMRHELARLAVEQFMTTDLITVTPETTIGTAAQLMLLNNLGGLPVVDEQKKLLGIITESDIFRMVVRHEWQLSVTHEQTLSRA